MPKPVDPIRRFKRESTVLLRTAQQRVRFRHFSSVDLPVIFGNAMPKSGSHILMQFLEGLMEIAPFVMRSKLPVRTLTMEGYRRSQSEILHDLARLRHGEIGWGYVPATAETMAALDGDDHLSFFVYRDPRDKIISHIFYALDIHEGHRMRAYYQDQLHSMEARIEATIRGVTQEPYLLPSIVDNYARYLPWLEHPRVLAIRFEDLVNDQEATLRRMLQHVESSGYELNMPCQQVMESLVRALDPGRSPTFREGKSGGWREHFSPRNVASFKEIAGNLLQKLGYEASPDW